MSNETGFLDELEESAQGQDLFRAPGREQMLTQARDQAEASGWLPPEVAENWQVDDQRAAISRRRQRLYDAMRQLESAAARASRQDDWAQRIHEASQELGNALVDHVEQTEGSGDFLDDVVDQAPRLENDVDLLRKEHRGLLSEFERLMSMTAATRTDVAEIRRAVLIVLGRLVEHRQRGAELLYDAYTIDLGNGD
jgi:hypothetical protein